MRSSKASRAARNSAGSPDTCTPGSTAATGKIASHWRKTPNWPANSASARSSSNPCRRSTVPACAFFTRRRLLRALPGGASHVVENTEPAEIEARPLAVHAGRHKIRCNYLVIATHTPLLGKTGMLKGTLLQSKLALYTSYVLGATLPRGSLPEALFWDTGDPYFYLRVDR